MPGARSRERREGRQGWGGSRETRETRPEAREGGGGLGPVSRSEREEQRMGAGQEASWASERKCRREGHSSPVWGSSRRWPWGERHTRHKNRSWKVNSAKSTTFADTRLKHLCFLNMWKSAWTSSK
jgi:hypothetical protein